MISAIGVSYLLQNCALYFTGGLPQIYPSIPFLSEQVQIGPASTKMVTIITPILTVILVLILCDDDQEDQDGHGHARSLPGL